MHEIVKNGIEICGVGGRCEVEDCDWGVTVGIQTDSVTSFFYEKIKCENFMKRSNPRNNAPHGLFGLTSISKQ